jgi:ATP-dependent DNA helicase RecQ
VEEHLGGEVSLCDTAGGQSQKLAAEATALQEHRRQFERSRVDMMRGYAATTHCRRQYLLSNFGEELAEPCGNCDNCEAHNEVGQTAVGQPFPVNSRVQHTQWGDGQVLRYVDDTVVVLFDRVGYKTLAVSVVLEHRLLRVVDV